ncbi:MAG: hypothetical protein MRZ79_08170 [Bacteroidia bacterium]|nr:hypothetical protein [Bacteroidia bacterium]
MNKKIFVLIFVGLSVISCKQEPSILEINFKPEVNGSAWTAETAFTLRGTDQVKVDHLEFFVSGLTLKKADGTEEFIDESFLIDMVDGSRQITLSIPEGDYTSLCFGLGVPEDRNLDNPAQYSEDHPLSIRTNMHWSWSTGYIFAKVEGDWDSEGNGNFDKFFLYHPGTMGLYQDVCIDEGINIDGEDPLAYDLIVEVPYLIASPSDTLDLATENFSHSTPVGSSAYKLAERVMLNLANEAIRRP